MNGGVLAACVEGAIRQRLNAVGHAGHIVRLAADDLLHVASNVGHTVLAAGLESIGASGIAPHRLHHVGHIVNHIEALAGSLDEAVAIRGGGAEGVAGEIAPAHLLRHAGEIIDNINWLLGSADVTVASAAVGTARRGRHFEEIFSM